MNSIWETLDLKEHLLETFKKGLRPVETQIISLCFYWSSYRRVSWVHVANSLLCKYRVCDYCSQLMQGKFLRENVSFFSPIYSWGNPSHVWPGPIPLNGGILNIGYSFQSPLDPAQQKVGKLATSLPTPNFFVKNSDLLHFDPSQLLRPSEGS